MKRWTSFYKEKKFLKICIRETAVCSYHKQIYYIGAIICTFNRNRIFTIRQFKRNIKRKRLIMKEEGG